MYQVDISVCHLFTTPFNQLNELLPRVAWHRAHWKPISSRVPAAHGHGHTPELRVFICWAVLSRFKKEQSFLPLRFVSILYIRKYFFSTSFGGIHRSLFAKFVVPRPRNGLDLRFRARALTGQQTLTPSVTFMASASNDVYEFRAWRLRFCGCVQICVFRARSRDPRQPAALFGTRV